MAAPSEDKKQEGIVRHLDPACGGDVLCNLIGTWMQVNFQRPSIMFEALNMNPNDGHFVLVAVRARLKHKVDGTLTLIKNRTPVRVSSTLVMRNKALAFVSIGRGYDFYFEPVDEIPDDTLPEDEYFWKRINGEIPIEVLKSALTLQRRPNKLLCLCHFVGEIDDKAINFDCTFGVDFDAISNTNN